MPKCPRCGKEIDRLINVQSGLISWEMFADGRYDDQEIEPYGEINEWDCPECSEPLFYNEDEAIAFLNNKSKVVESDTKK